MPIKTVHCHVLQTQVTTITDMEGGVVRVICSQYERPSGTCRIKQRVSSGGPLSRLIERTSEGILDSRSPKCRVVT